MRSDSGAGDAGTVCGIVVLTVAVAAVPPGGDSRQDELPAARQALSRSNLPEMTSNDSKYSLARRPWGERTADPELTPRNRTARWSRGDGLRYSRSSLLCESTVGAGTIAFHWTP
jgi:hypothetical protein